MRHLKTYLMFFFSPDSFYAHYNCALWSDNVIHKTSSGDKESSSSSSSLADEAAKTFQGVETAVVNAMFTKCAYCKHFGASVRCKGAKESSKTFYHFACGAASGSFMNKPTLLLVGTESLHKVASLGELTKNLL